MDCTFEFERGVVSRWSSARDNVNMIIYPHSLAGINSDILEGVLEHLSEYDLIALQATCKYFRYIVQIFAERHRLVRIVSGPLKVSDVTFIHLPEKPSHLDEEPPAALHYLPQRVIHGRKAAFLQVSIHPNPKDYISITGRESDPKLDQIMKIPHHFITESIVNARLRPPPTHPNEIFEEDLVHEDEEGVAHLSASIEMMHPPGAPLPLPPWRVPGIASVNPPKRLFIGGGYGQFDLFDTSIASSSLELFALDLDRLHAPRKPLFADILPSAIEEDDAEKEETDRQDALLEQRTKEELLGDKGSRKRKVQNQRAAFSGPAHQLKSKSAGQVEHSCCDPVRSTHQVHEVDGQWSMAAILNEVSLEEEDGHRFRSEDCVKIEIDASKDKWILPGWPVRSCGYCNRRECGAKGSALILLSMFRECAKSPDRVFDRVAILPMPESLHLLREPFESASQFAGQLTECERWHVHKTTEELATRAGLAREVGDELTAMKLNEESEALIASIYQSRKRSWVFAECDGAIPLHREAFASAAFKPEIGACDRENGESRAPLAVIFGGLDASTPLDDLYILCVGESVRVRERVLEKRQAQQALKEQKEKRTSTRKRLLEVEKKKKETMREDVVDVLVKLKRLLMFHENDAHFISSSSDNNTTTTINQDSNINDGNIRSNSNLNDINNESISNQRLRRISRRNAELTSRITDQSEHKAKQEIISNYIVDRRRQRRLAAEANQITTSNKSAFPLSKRSKFNDEQQVAESDLLAEGEEDSDNETEGTFDENNNHFEDINQENEEGLQDEEQDEMEPGTIFSHSIQDNDTQNQLIGYNNNNLNTDALSESILFPNPDDNIFSMHASHLGNGVDFFAGSNENQPSLPRRSLERAPSDDPYGILSAPSQQGEFQRVSSGNLTSFAADEIKREVIDYSKTTTLFSKKMESINADTTCHTEVPIASSFHSENILKQPTENISPAPQQRQQQQQLDGKALSSLTSSTQYHHHHSSLNQPQQSSSLETRTQQLPSHPALLYSNLSQQRPTSKVLDAKVNIAPDLPKFLSLSGTKGVLRPPPISAQKLQAARSADTSARLNSRKHGLHPKAARVARAFAAVISQTGDRLKAEKLESAALTMERQVLEAEREKHLSDTLLQQQRSQLNNNNCNGNSNAEVEDNSELPSLQTSALKKMNAQANNTSLQLQEWQAPYLAYMDALLPDVQSFDPELVLATNRSNNEAPNQLLMARIPIPSSSRLSKRLMGSLSSKVDELIVWTEKLEDGIANIMAGLEVDTESESEEANFLTEASSSTDYRNNNDKHSNHHQTSSSEVNELNSCAHVEFDINWKPYENDHGPLLTSPLDISVVTAPPLWPALQSSADAYNEWLTTSQLNSFSKKFQSPPPTKKKRITLKKPATDLPPFPVDPRARQLPKLTDESLLPLQNGYAKFTWLRVSEPSDQMARICGSKDLPLWPPARFGHAMCTIGSSMFMFGGRGGWFDDTLGEWKGAPNVEMLRDIWVLRREMNAVGAASGLLSKGWTWYCPRVTGSIPSGRASHCMTAAGVHLVVFGGWNGKHYLSDFHVLNTGSLVWSILLAGSAHFPLDSRKPPPPDDSGLVIRFGGIRAHSFSSKQQVCDRNENSNLEETTLLEPKIRDVTSRRLLHHAASPLTSPTDLVYLFPSNHCAISQKIFPITTTVGAVRKSLHILRTELRRNLSSPPPDISFPASPMLIGKHKEALDVVIYNLIPSMEVLGLLPSAGTPLNTPLPLQCELSIAFKVGVLDASIRLHKFVSGDGRSPSYVAHPRMRCMKGLESNYSVCLDSFRPRHISFDFLAVGLKVNQGLSPKLFSSPVANSFYQSSSIVIPPRNANCNITDLCLPRANRVRSGHLPLLPRGYHPYRSSWLRGRADASICFDGIDTLFLYGGCDHFSPNPKTFRRRDVFNDLIAIKIEGLFSPMVSSDKAFSLQEQPMSHVVLSNFLGSNVGPSSQSSNSSIMSSALSSSLRANPTSVSSERRQPISSQMPYNTRFFSSNGNGGGGTYPVHVVPSSTSQLSQRASVSAAPHARMSFSNFVAQQQYQQRNRTQQHYQQIPSQYIPPTHISSSNTSSSAAPHLHATQNTSLISSQQYPYMNPYIAAAHVAASFTKPSNMVVGSAAPTLQSSTSISSSSIPFSNVSSAGAYNQASMMIASPFNFMGNTTTAPHLIGRGTALFAQMPNGLSTMAFTQQLQMMQQHQQHQQNLNKQ